MEPFGGAPPSRLCTSEETPPVKSIRVRSVCPNAVRSRVAIWLVLWTIGPTPEVLMVPVKFVSVTSCATPPAETKFTTSLPPPMSMAPRMREPGSSVSVSASLPSRIAVPLMPMMVPELVMVEAPMRA